MRVRSTVDRRAAIGARLRFARSDRARELLELRGVEHDVFDFADALVAIVVHLFSDQVLRGELAIDRLVAHALNTSHRTAANRRSA